MCVCATTLTSKNGILSSKCISVSFIVLRIEDDYFPIVSKFVAFELSLAVTRQVENGVLKSNLNEFRH